MKQQQDSKTLANEWWDNLGKEKKILITDLYFPHNRYYQNSMEEKEFMYLSEHPEPKEEETDMDWGLYPGNEAGAFDHLDNQQFNEDMVIKELEKELTTTPKETAPTEAREGFTFGDWVIKPSGTNEFDYVVTDSRINDEKTVPICAVYASNINDCAEANARLIANAPKMYEALKALMWDDDVCATIGRNNAQQFKELLNKINNTY